MAPPRAKKSPFLPTPWVYLLEQLVSDSSCCLLLLIIVWSFDLELYFQVLSITSERMQPL